MCFPPLSASAPFFYHSSIYPFIVAFVPEILPRLNHSVHFARLSRVEEGSVAGVVGLHLFRMPCLPRTDIFIRRTDRDIWNAIAS